MHGIQSRNSHRRYLVSPTLTDRREATNTHIPATAGRDALPVPHRSEPLAGGDDRWNIDSLPLTEGASGAGAAERGRHLSAKSRVSKGSLSEKCDHRDPPPGDHPATDRTSQ